MGTRRNAAEASTHMDVKIHPYNGDGPIVAFASVTLEGCFAVRGVKVMEGKNGLFISMPRRQVKGDYQDICFPCTKAFKKEFDQKILDAYQQTLTWGGQEQGLERPKEDGPSMDMKM